MPTANGQVKRNAGLSLALALLALVSAPSLVTAQYTLTFDPPQSTGADGVIIPSPYLYPLLPSVVTITDGYANSFGSIGMTNNTCGNGNHQSLCFNTTNVASPASGITAVYHDGNGSNGIGEFRFAPGTGKTTDFVSVVIGNTNVADRAAHIEIYDLAGTTLLATYNNTNLAKGTAVTVSLLTDFTFASGKTESDLGNGFRFEWGSTAAATGGVDNLYIDNLVFSSEIAPEPSSFLLLGTGLLGLAPLVGRRRRKV